MEVIIAKDYETLSRQAATIIAAQIIGRPDSVLGLHCLHWWGPISTGCLVSEGIIDLAGSRLLISTITVLLTIPAAIAGLWRKTS